MPTLRAIGLRNNAGSLVNGFVRTIRDANQTDTPTATPIVQTASITNGDFALDTDPGLHQVLVYETANPGLSIISTRLDMPLGTATIDLANLWQYYGRSLPSRGRAGGVILSACLPAPVTLTGIISTEVPMFRFTVPGNSCIAPMERLEIRYRANVTPNTNTKTIRIRHVSQGNAIIQGNIWSAAAVAGVEVLRRLTYVSPTSYRSSVPGVTFADFGNNPNAFPDVFPIDWTQDNIFEVTGLLAVATDSIDLLEVHPTLVLGS